MDKSRRRRFLWLAVPVVLVGVLIWWLVVGRTKPSGQEATAALQVSGVIEADEVQLSPTLGGRIAALDVAEGDVVQAGQRLATLDTTLLDGQIAVAEAQLALARAALAASQAGARPGTLAVAEAQLTQAQAAREVAVQTLADVQALRANPQQLDMQVAVAEAQVEAAGARLRSATALKGAAEVAKNTYTYVEDLIRNWHYPVPPPGMPGDLTTAPTDWWKSWAGLNAASATLEAAQAQLEHDRAVRASPQELDARVEAAKAGLQQASAAVDAAQAQVDGLRAGATSQQLAAALARVAQAQGALDGLQAQRDEARLVAPSNGVVLALLAHVGEVTAAGIPLVTLADLSEVSIRVYVAEDRLGQVAVGQEVTLLADALPGRRFAGRITHIADQPQYTPRNVATKEERVNTVYAVEIRLPNADRALKPGMPADVLLEPPATGQLPAGEQTGGVNA